MGMGRHAAAFHPPDQGQQVPRVGSTHLQAFL